MTQVPVGQLLEQHRALRAAGVESYDVRRRMITLDFLRTHDFAAWVKARAAMEVFDVIEADGEQMEHQLTKGRGGFRRDEITLARPRQINAGRAVQ